MRVRRMGDIVQFPGKQSLMIAHLDVSIACIQNLQSASRLSAGEMRVEALGARIDIASVREELDSLLSTLSLAPGPPVEIEGLRHRIECLFDQVVICVSFLLEESCHFKQNFAARAELRSACQSTLSELRKLRSILVPLTNCAEA
jgi:hypothetical protein